MTLEQFEAELVRVIGRPTSLRPFVCEGSPLDCKVFIVGYNPATSLEGDWWRFWQAGYGYRKQAWFQEYQNERNGRVSKTRKRIETIVAQLGAVSVLEANIDARPSRRKSEYPRPITEPFDCVIKMCRPKVIITHGVDAVSHLQSLAPSGVLIPNRHFIYIGNERTAQIVAETKKALSEC